MKKRYAESLKCKVIERLQALSSNVVLRADFDDLGGGYRQISRVLNALVADKKLVKIGFGVYTKAYASKYVKQALIKGGSDTAFKEALTRLGIRWEPGWAEKAYNSGQSTQVPVRTVVRLKSRFRRCLADGDYKLIFENNKNAR